MTSFTYYNDTVNDDNETLTERADISALRDFGLSVERAYTAIQPVINGTAQTQLTISASDKDVPGVYDIVFPTKPEDQYSYLAGGIGQTLLRINVTSDAGHVQRSMTQTPAYLY